MHQLLKKGKLKLMKYSHFKNRFTKICELRCESFEQFAKNFETVTRTNETEKEYSYMNATQRTEIKDVGGFVGGTFKDNERKSSQLISRSVICLDVDKISDLDIIEKAKQTYKSYTHFIYTTHSNNKDLASFRIVFELSEDVSSEDYTQIAKKLASMLGLSYFDVTTFQPSRLMFYPSCSSDSLYSYSYNKANSLIPGEFLQVGTNNQHTTETALKQPKNKANNEDKKNIAIINRFNRYYTITDAIETFLSDVYEPGTTPKRYSLVGGSVADGLIVNDDNSHAYSFDATSNNVGKCLDAFDLVRVSLFGNDNNSFRSMISLCLQDKKVYTPKSKINAFTDFKKFIDDLPARDSLQACMSACEWLGIKPTPNNALLIRQFLAQILGAVFDNKSAEQMLVISGNCSTLTDFLKTISQQCYCNAYIGAVGTNRLTTMLRNAFICEVEQLDSWQANKLTKVTSLIANKNVINGQDTTTKWFGLIGNCADSLKLRELNSNNRFVFLEVTEEKNTPADLNEFVTSIWCEALHEYRLNNYTYYFVRNNENYTDVIGYYSVKLYDFMKYEISNYLNYFDYFCIYDFADILNIEKKELYNNKKLLIQLNTLLKKQAEKNGLIWNTSARKRLTIEKNNTIQIRGIICAK